MKRQHSFFVKAIILLPVLFYISCSATEMELPQVETSETMGTVKFNYLALGDSYTVGESVDDNLSFPAQLVEKLNEALEEKTKVDIVGATGWRTDNLLNAINNQGLQSNYDIVTLLVGVNNQFQNRPFSQYETEFSTLLEKAITLAKGDNQHVFVISIPDYAFTPFGANLDREQISTEINQYNDYARETATDAGVRFINITDITRNGLDEPELVANDGLHPSGEAYRRFVERILPFARSRLIE